MSHHVAAMRLITILLVIAHLAGCATALSESDTRDHLERTDETSIRLKGRSPTVVLQSGFGDDKVVWAGVMEELNGYAVFAYDRPGYGRNPASETPRDPCTIAAELRAQLQNTGLQPPYMLVGHSLGGLYQYVFARLYPTEVAGLVLLDPTHPLHWETMQREVPTSASLIRAMRAIAFSSTERREFDAQSTCLERLDSSRPLNVPTRLLVSGRFKPIEQGDYAAMLKRLRQDWLLLVRAPRVETIHDAGHYIQKDTPEEVAATVRSLVENPLERGATGITAGKAHRQPAGIVSGHTNQQEIRQRYGEPGEKLREGDNEIWIYNNRLKTPTVVSLIPFVGDIAGTFELIWNIPNNEELIVQFDVLGLVKKASLRKLD